MSRNSSRHQHFVYGAGLLTVQANSEVLKPKISLLGYFLRVFHKESDGK
jgi:hypothetical protein